MKNCFKDWSQSKTNGIFDKATSIDSEWSIVYSVGSIVRILEGVRKIYKYSKRNCGIALFGYKGSHFICLE